MADLASVRAEIDRARKPVDRQRRDSRAGASRSPMRSLCLRGSLPSSIGLLSASATVSRPRSRAQCRTSAWRLQLASGKAPLQYGPQHDALPARAGYSAPRSDAASTSNTSAISRCFADWQADAVTFFREPTRNVNAAATDCAEFCVGGNRIVSRQLRLCVLALGRHEVAETEGFEPSIGLYNPITV